MSSGRSSVYAAAGVDTEREEVALHRLVEEIRATWPERPGIGSVKLPVGYFANVVEAGPGLGLALTADGVGTKVLIAQMLGRYDTVGIDCVAMNVNDLLCVGAKPLTMVDYIAIQEPDPDVIEGIARGLREGALLAGISIPGGEIAQVPEIVQGWKPRAGFDLAGSAVGIVPLDRIIIGQEIAAGDAVIGIESSGIHSNGLTLARRVLLVEAGYALSTTPPGFTRTLGEELLTPTSIYVPEILDLLEQALPIKALIHVTSDGLLNLTRVAAKVGYVIERLPPVPPIFSLIQKSGALPPEEMFHVFNMGIGFCVVVQRDAAERAISIIESHGRNAYLLGHAVDDAERRVFIRPADLVGKGKAFVKA